MEKIQQEMIDVFESEIVGHLSNSQGIPTTDLESAALPVRHRTILPADLTFER